MVLDTRLVQKMSQNLLMTPQLQQAIKLLQLGRLEYQEAIERELLENPLLEEAREDSDYRNSSENNGINLELNNGNSFEEYLKESAVTDWESYLENFHDSVSTKSAKFAFEEDSYTFEENLSPRETLIEHLLGQLQLHDFTHVEKNILSQLLGNIDKRGYLRIPLEEVAEITGTNLQKVQDVHFQLTLLDPVGVGAIDLKQCLLIQLERKGLQESLETKIVSEYLALLEKRKFDEIAKRLAVSISDIAIATKNIAALNPHPARQFSDEDARYVIPDVYIQKIGSNYQIILNDEGLPKLRINDQYLKLLNNGNSKDKTDKTYLQERAKSASWLLKSIDQRQRTIYKVTESIVKFQLDFLDYGIEKLKPLVLKEVADDINMHESTVSRITSNKFCHTPQGIFELKYFFTAGIKTAKGDVSSSAIKEKIRQIIQSESARTPISDQRIVEILVSQKIDIARRTVAKYRESLGIQSSSQRKRLF
jgi:RNA polymerase sigma-54 factor